jgi:RNA polymerase sigma-70 factor, ECF subfamily
LTSRRPFRGFASARRRLLRRKTGRGSWPSSKRELVNSNAERSKPGGTGRRLSSQEEYRGLIEKFTEAARAGDEATLLSLFAEDATLTSDGGGGVPAARKVVRGRRRIARLFLVLARKFRGRMAQTILNVNGEPGLVISFQRRAAGHR